MATAVWWFLCGVVVLWVLGAVLVIASAISGVGADRREERAPVHAAGGVGNDAVKQWSRLPAPADINLQLNQIA